MTDQELLREFTERGSERAFQSLVERHVNLVFATALRRVSDAAAAQEITQNVFIALARKAAWLRGEVALAGWLHKTTLLEARQWWRGELRRQLRERTAVELGTTMKDDPSLLKSLESVLDEGLMELRDTDRQALMLRYFEERSHREIGLMFGVGEDAARKHIATALDKLTAFFRRRGYAVPAATTTAEALRAAAHAAPIGLSSAAAKAALSASGAMTLSGLGLLFAKFMGLTKTQTIAISLLAATVPLTYEWHAGRSKRAEQRALETELTATRGDLLERQRSLDQTRRRLQTIEAAIAEARGDIARSRARISPARADDDANLYLWSENSDYVRLPKTMAKQLTLSGERRPVNKDGVLSLPLVEALGITPDEQSRVQDSFRELQRDYQGLVQAHTYITNAPLAEMRVGERESRTIVTTAFPEEGETLKQRLRSSLEAAFGQERADIVYDQAQQTFYEQFNNLGARERFETIAAGPDKKLSYWEWTRVPGQQDFDTKSHHTGWPRLANLPELLRPFVAGYVARFGDKP